MLEFCMIFILIIIGLFILASINLMIAIANADNLDLEISFGSKKIINIHKNNEKEGRDMNDKDNI